LSARNSIWLKVASGAFSGPAGPLPGSSAKSVVFADQCACFSDRRAFSVITIVDL
jgi:hypothetical protein